jgi:hypothetical protein
MTLLSPSENLEIQYLMGVVNISISGKNNDKQKFLLGSWLLFWALVLLFPLTIAYQVISGNFQREGIPNSSLVILGVVSMLGIFFWGMRGVLAAYVLFLKIAGLETLEISRNGLKIRKSIFGIGKTKEYKKENITSIKLGTENINAFCIYKIQIHKV